MEREQSPRTDFLTILCILSLIGSGIMILSGINAYREGDLQSALMREQIQKSRQEIKVKSKSKEGEVIAEQMIGSALDAVNPEKVKLFSIVSIICNALTFIGASLMFRHRKAGFWVYVLGTVAMVAAPFFVYNGSNLISWATSMGFGFIGLIFVLLYARQLKYMY